MSVVVAGEALIDLAPRDGLLVPLPGGSPFNVAAGIGRLGGDARYLGRLSRDPFGLTLRRRLAADGVDTSLAPSTDEPTSLAVVHLDDEARASYGFYLDGTSAAGLAVEELPDLGHATAVHVSFGAVTLDTDPGGRTLRSLVSRERGRRFVSLDPNVRPSVIRDPPGYAGRLDALVREVDLVKASHDDLEALARSGVDPQARARAWAGAGPVLVVVTRGPEGGVAWTADGRTLEIPAEPVDVVDTVGAGDAFTAGLLAGFDRRGCLSRQAVAGLDDAALVEVLAEAAHVAALTCTRPGADPPRRDEL